MRPNPTSKQLDHIRQTRFKNLPDLAKHVDSCATALHSQIQALQELIWKFQQDVNALTSSSGCLAGEVTEFITPLIKTHGQEKHHSKRSRVQKVQRAKARR